MYSIFSNPKQSSFIFISPTATDFFNTEARFFTDLPTLNAPGF